MLLESAFHWLFCLEYSFKLVTFSKSYTRKQEWMFFFWTQCSNFIHFATPHSWIWFS